MDNINVIPINVDKTEIMVELKRIPAKVSTVVPSLHFWLTLDEADNLAFQLNSTLQEIEREKVKKD